MTALVVVVLALGVLAAALVKLAGGSGSSATPRTTTLTGVPAASVPPATVPTITATTTPGATAPPTATTPTSTAPSQATPGSGKHLTPLEQLEQLRRQGARKGK